MSRDRAPGRRRWVLAGTAGLVASGSAASFLAGGDRLRRIEEGFASIGIGEAPPRLLIRSVWQWENIGDIAHGLGIVALVRRVLPNASITLWTGRLNEASRSFLAGALPDVDILEVDASAARKRIVLATCSFLLSGSSAGFAARSAIQIWRSHGERPFGLFGMTLSTADLQHIDLIKQARFALFRDSESLRSAQAAGVSGAAFVPDDAFACPRPDPTPKHDALRAQLRLGTRPYVCCIPRFRYTPLWTYRNVPIDPAKAAFNEAHVETDHAPIRQAMISAVRDHGVELLICPEDVTQIALGRTALYDPLPDDVKASTRVLDRYWMPDEAMSVFANAAALLSADQHSPILAVTLGVPAVLCRSKEQSTKGIMWRDLGLGDWLFDFDEPRRMEQLSATLDHILRDLSAARSKARDASRLARNLQLERMREAARQIVTRDP